MDDVRSPADGELHPDPSRDALRASPWFVVAALIAVMLACAPPLLIRPLERVSTHTMENVALVTSQETWLRLHKGDARARWIAFNDAAPRVEKPPFVVWLNMLAWSDLDPAKHNPDTLMRRARCVSVIMGFVLIAATFWMGATLHGCRTAVAAALAAGSMYFVHRQAQTASYDIHLASWAALSVAAGLWAIKFIGQSPSILRRIIGWALCSLALACSILSKNALALAIVLPPLISAIALSPAPRKPHIWALVGATIAALTPVAVWYAYVSSEYPGAVAALRAEFQQARPDDFQPVYYYLGLLLLIAPWTVWMIGGLVRAFRNRRHRLGLAAWVAFIWFVFIFVLFSIPAAKQQRYILPIVPAAALLIALFWTVPTSDNRCPSERRFAHVLGRGFGAALIVVGLAAGPFAAMQAWLVERFPILLPVPFIEPVSWRWAFVISAVMAALAALVLVAHWRRRTMPAIICTAVWALTITTIVWSRYEGAPDRVRDVHTFRSEAARAAAIVRDLPVGVLRRAGAERINEEFRFYFGRLIEPVSVNELLRNPAVLPERSYLFARPEDDLSRPLRRAGFRQIGTFQADKDDSLELWRRRRFRALPNPSS